MLRLIAIFAFFATALSSVIAPLSAIHPGTVVIGGEYTVEPGEVRHGDMIAVFARVKIAEGGEVTGQIRVYGGELDVADSIAKNTQSVEYLRGWFLLPSILLVVS